MERFTYRQLFRRIRQNHALEHATITILSKKHEGFSAQGNSTPLGFNLNIYGDVTEEEVPALDPLQMVGAAIQARCLQRKGVLHQLSGPFRKGRNLFRVRPPQRGASLLAPKFG